MSRLCGGDPRSRWGVRFGLLALAALLWTAPLHVFADGVTGDVAGSAAPEAASAPVSRIDLVPAEDAQGKRLGTLVLASLTSAEAPSRASERPLMIVFNGGPGAGSAWLQLGLLGPQRAVFGSSASPARLLTSRDGLWDRADLLFVDPLGTGFSRAARGVDPQRYREWRADGDYLARAITGWITAHGRQRAPVILVGESYGTERLIAVAEALERERASVRLGGMALISQTVLSEFGIGATDPARAAAIGLPTIAATACHFGRSTVAPGGPLACAEAAWQAAASDPAALARLTGLPEAVVSRRWPAFSREQYRLAALADQAQVLGRYDSRLHDRADPARGWRDPSLDALIPQMTRLARLAARHVMGLAASPLDGSPYILFDPAILHGWRYGPQAPSPGSPEMAARLGAVLTRTRAPLLVAGGVFDMVGAYGADRELGLILPLTPGQSEVASYPGGHMFYLDPLNRLGFLARLRLFIRRVEAQGRSGAVPAA